MSTERSIKILVVDDNPATLYSTGRVLRGAGWTVIEAQTGDAALRLAEQAVDAIVLDVDLPDIDGFEVCRRLRQQDTTARIPVLHLSATFVSGHYKVHGLESGADAYLTHPVEPPVLIATVNALLRTRQAELELLDSEARFRGLFESALNGVGILDNELTFKEVNPSFCRLLKADRSGLIGRSLREFVVEDDASRIREVAATLMDENAWRGEFPLRRADGRLVYLEWHISMHGQPGLRLAIVSDITARIQFDRERERLLLQERQARAEAEQANRIKDDFLATLSHELRTPLNAIVGWSQVLSAGQISAADTAEGIDAIQRNAQAQAQMIADLLDVSRITSGKLRLNLQAVDVVSLLNEVISSVQPEMELKFIRLERQFHVPTCKMVGDPERLKQVFLNLLTNATKFTPQNGKVDVALSCKGPEVEIRVSDNGQGIEPELLPHVFDRFRQGDASTTRHYGGLGLGLAIARQLIELHDGSITAESAGLGKGATFSVRLPNRQITGATVFDSSRTTSANDTDTSMSLRGIRVLVVEDQLDSRKLLERILSGVGAELLGAGSAQDALAALESFNPHVVVSDIGMPGEDGFSLLREIRRRGYSSTRLPSVALTAFASNDDHDRVLAAGFQAHVAKPVDAHTILLTVQSVLRPN